MLNRMKLAIIIILLSLICTFTIDIIVHLKEVNCMMIQNFHKGTNESIISHSNFPEPGLYQNMYFLIFQHVLSALANMLMDIAVLEFICSQSPYSMKGMLFGIFLSMRYFFQGIAIISMVPFGTLWNIQSISCGSGFYLMNIVIGLLSFVLFVCVAKRYKYRELNEPSNEYRYAEEYYSNIQ